VAELVEAAHPFNLALKDHVPDEQPIEWISFTAGDFRKLAQALSRHQENSNG